MKIPSLSKIPKYRQFNYEPRYYDPTKEDLKNRTERIRGELRAENGQVPGAGIREAFRRRERETRHASTMQLVLMLLMMGCFLGWIFYGNIALYAFLVLFPLYVFLRTRKFFQS